MVPRSNSTSWSNTGRAASKLVPVVFRAGVKFSGEPSEQIDQRLGRSGRAAQQQGGEPQAHRAKRRHAVSFRLSGSARRAATRAGIQTGFARHRTPIGSGPARPDASTARRRAAAHAIEAAAEQPSVTGGPYRHRRRCRSSHKRFLISLLPYAKRVLRGPPRLQQDPHHDARRHRLATITPSPTSASPAGAARRSPSPRPRCPA